MKTNSITTGPRKIIEVDLVDFLKTKKQDIIPPKGFYSREEISQKLKLCKSKTNQRIKELMDDNLLEVLNLKRLHNDVYRIVPHYKLK